MSIIARRLQAASQMPNNNFIAFAAGTTKPLGYGDAGQRNVGPRIDNLVRHDGDIVLTSGSVVSGLDIHGQVTGRGGTVTDCIIRGHNTVDGAVHDPLAVGQSYDFGGATFSWCRFDGSGTENQFSDCIDGGNYVARYCEFTRGVDGIGANTVGNATIECSRIWNGHYEAWWDDSANAPRTTSYQDADGVTHNPPFSTQSSGDTHSDGIQIQQYDGWVIRGCYIGGVRTFGGGPYTHLDPTLASDQSTIDKIDSNMDYNNSAIIINSASSSHPTGALIEKNWLQGGMARVNLAGTKSYDKFAGVTIQNNRFIRSTWSGPGYYIYTASDCAATLTDNVFDDDGSPVTVSVA